MSGCWYCNKIDAPMLFCSEFDTDVHGKCVVEAMLRDRHRETLLIFYELFMGPGDMLLKTGDHCDDGCFELLSDGNWHQISSLEGRTVLSNEIIVRRNSEA